MVCIDFPRVAKGRIYPGEHQAIVPRALWNKVHALLQTSPRARVAQNRRHQTALLKGLIFGLDGRALSPTHSRKKGRMYRYYVAQRVLKEEPTGGDDILRRISAAQIEGAVIGQVRALLRQPEIVAGGWLAARQEPAGWYWALMAGMSPSDAASQAMQR